jgi:hypothetical protein
MAWSNVNNTALADPASGIDLGVDTADVQAAGNLLVVVTRWENADTTVTVTDTLGTEYVEAAHGFSAAAGAALAVHLGIAPSSGANQITFHLGAARTFRQLQCFEYSGTTATSGLTAQDRAATTTGTTANPTVGPITPRADGELIFAAVGNAQGVTYAQVAPFTEIREDTDTQCQDVFQGAAAAISSSWTAAVANWTALIISVRAVDGPPDATAGRPWVE